MGKEYAHAILTEMIVKGYTVETYLEDKFVRNEWRGVEYYQSIREAAQTQFVSNDAMKNRIAEHCDLKIDVLTVQLQKETERKAKEAAMEKLLTDNLVASTAQLNQRGITFITGGLIGIVAGVLGGLTPVLVERCTPRTLDTIPVCVLNYPSIPDTMKTVIIDSPSDTLPLKDSIAKP